MRRIRVGVIGVGNCASSLLQGIEYYRERLDPSESQAADGSSTAEGSSYRAEGSFCRAEGSSYRTEEFSERAEGSSRPVGASQQDSGEQANSTPPGLMHWEIGGYRPGDLDIVAAFDVDARKVGRDVAEAIFAEPNCTLKFHSEVPLTGTRVRMSPLLDGIPDHMSDYPESRRFVVANQPEPSREEVISELRESGAEVLLNYLPVGAESATRFWAECALEAGCAFVNSIPVFIASDPQWSQRFAKAGLPIIGDDIKAQLGATITHRTLAELFHHRGVQLDRTYQLNTGGNTDFLNMLNRARLSTKKTSKTEAVQAAAGRRLADDDIHVGPSDYVPWQRDNKVCFIRMEGRLFGDVPMNLELRLSVEDSPNSAGVGIDAIRCCKVALERRIGGVLRAPSAYFCKHPLEQISDETAYRLTEAFINASWHARKEAKNDSMKADRPAKTSDAKKPKTKMETE